MMDESCKHQFDDSPSVFTGTLRSRKCSKCERVEVLLANGSWVDIETYLLRQVANRSNQQV